MTDTTTITRDGRTICLHTTGSRDADRCVVFVHPSPGSGAFDPDPDQTARRHVLLVGVDRPGYGGSDPAPERDGSGIAAAADDIAAVLDHLGFTKAGMAGWSTGGYVAAYLAARRPELVDRLVLLGTPASNDEAVTTLDDADPPAWLADVHDETARARLDVMFEHGRTRAGTEPNTEAVPEFDPADVQAKALLLYGTADTQVKGAQARWWKDRLPNSRIEMMPGVGQQIVVPAWKRVLSHLAPGSIT